MHLIRTVKHFDVFTNHEKIFYNECIGMRFNALTNATGIVKLLAMSAHASMTQQSARWWLFLTILFEKYNTG